MKILISIIIVIVVIFLGFLLLKGDSEKHLNIVEKLKSANREFDKAPNFSLQDIDGNTVELSDFAGKVLIINSWASWCPFCVDELPDFSRLQKEFGDEIVMIAINRQESLEKSKAYTNQIGATNDMLYLLDPKDSFYKSIGGFSMPETIFVDDNQNIIIHKRGPMELLEMREKVNSILQN
jgi:thiol-disulfide isomerase/thioredoxin